MSCEKKQTVVASKAARASGITKLSSKSAYAVGAGSVGPLTPLKPNENVRPKNGTLPGKAAGGQSKKGNSPQARLARLKQIRQRVKERQAQKKLLAKSRRALTAKNVKRFHQAIQARQKVTVRYQTAGQRPREATVVPLDVKRGLSDETRGQKYMWCYFEQLDMSRPLKLDNIVEVKPSDESFDLKALRANSRWWKAKLKKNEWVLPRSWAGTQKSGQAAPKGKS